MSETRNTEARLRRMLRRRGYILFKKRSHAAYEVGDHRSRTVLGPMYSASLADVEAFASSLARADLQK